MGRDSIAMLPGREFLLARCSFKLLAMRVNVREDDHLIAFQALESERGVTGPLGASAAKVMHGIDVIKRSCEAVSQRFGVHLGSLAQGWD